MSDTLAVQIRGALKSAIDAHGPITAPRLTIGGLGMSLLAGVIGIVLTQVLTQRQ